MIRTTLSLILATTCVAGTASAFDFSSPRGLPSAPEPTACVDQFELNELTHNRWQPVAVWCLDDDVMVMQTHETTDAVRIAPLPRLTGGTWTDGATLNAFQFENLVNGLNHALDDGIEIDQDLIDGIQYDIDNLVQDYVFDYGNRSHGWIDGFLLTIQQMMQMFQDASTLWVGGDSGDALGILWDIGQALMADDTRLGDHDDDGTVNAYDPDYNQSTSSNAPWWYQWLWEDDDDDGQLNKDDEDPWGRSTDFGLSICEIAPAFCDQTLVAGFGADSDFMTLGVNLYRAGAPEYFTVQQATTTVFLQ